MGVSPLLAAPLLAQDPAQSPVELDHVVLPQHPGRWRRVRPVVVHGPTAQMPSALARLGPARVEWRADAGAATAWVEMELEGGTPGGAGRTVDLRPTLPLVLRR